MSEFQRPQFGAGQTPRFVMMMFGVVTATGVAYAAICFVQLNGVYGRLNQAEELSRRTSAAISSVMRVSLSGHSVSDEAAASDAASFDGSIALRDWSESHTKLAAAVASSSSDDDLTYVMSKLDSLHETITAGDSSAVGPIGLAAQSAKLDALVRYQEGSVLILENTTAAYRMLASRCIQILAIVIAFGAAAAMSALSYLFYRIGAVASLDRAISALYDVVRDELGRGQSKLTMLALEIFAQRRADQEIRIELAELQSSRRALSHGVSVDDHHGSGVPPASATGRVPFGIAGKHD